MFKHKFQEQPVHKNKERCAVPQFPCVYIVSTANVTTISLLLPFNAQDGTGPVLQM